MTIRVSARCLSAQLAKRVVTESTMTKQAVSKKLWRYGKGDSTAVDSSNSEKNNKNKKQDTVGLENG